MQEQPIIKVSTENGSVADELENLKQIDCQVGEVVNGECESANVRCADSCPISGGGVKAKRKARSTRRRLNAMINNTSLHFSDTDSEGELTAPRISTPNHSAPESGPDSASSPADGKLLHPIISVTLDASDDSSYGGSRRNSYLENLTDVDEIYTSDPEANEAAAAFKCRPATSPRGSLSVGDASRQGETDLEEMSNEDDEEAFHPQILVKLRSDILCDFNGETITTKEGDGPFSIEVRNQMSLDEPMVGPSSGTPDILVQTTTDSEDMEASDEDDETEGACAPRRSVYEDFDVIAASQIVMKNVDKMEQLLAIKEPELDAMSDSHTDVEDIE